MFIVLLVIFLVSTFFRFVPFGLWITAKSSGVDISMGIVTTIGSAHSHKEVLENPGAGIPG